MQGGRSMLSNHRQCLPKVTFFITLLFMLVLSLLFIPQSGYAVDCFREIDPIYLATDPRNEIHIHNDSDITLVRNQIINFIWKGGGMPSQRSARVIENIQGTPYLNTAGTANLARIDEMHIEMDLGFTSVVFMLHPVQSNNRLVIFHQGHGSDLNLEGGNETISFFLERGFTVLAFYMPLFGPNTGPVATHDAMASLESAAVNPMKFFLEPIAVALNYIDDEYNFSDVIMTGISGGGWTTHVYAAIDPTR
jgi:pimeloyl-ACP methyl ester carboxylesterase